MLRPLSDVEILVNTLKTLCIDGVEKAGSGHPGTPMGLADVAIEIWGSYLRHDPLDPDWIGRDRFVLSCGHASMLIYSLLHMFGYDLSLDDLKQFRQWGAKTPGHPESHVTRGIETTTGPLGQGIANAVGFALAAKMKAARFGEPFESSKVFVLASDGDVMEGISAEAGSITGHLGLGNLIVIWDDNRITIEGKTDLAFTEDVGKRYEAYGFEVTHIDGHDHMQIRSALDKATQDSTKPHFIVARTHIAFGAPHAQDTSEAHGAPLGKDEISAFKKSIGFDPEKSFAVPERASSALADVRSLLASERDEWNHRFSLWQKEHAEKAKQLLAFEAKELPPHLFDELLKVAPAKEDATRNLSNVIQQKVGELMVQLVGGSADLAPSTKTFMKAYPSISRQSYAGRNIHFGIREHVMGAICNALALSGGFIPYGSTFLVFSDYMRGAIRLSALMEQQVIWIFTHDSIFLGEDGPTHQPIEHLASLRLIPNLLVIRPADALEVAAAWTLALERKRGPSTLSLTRQKVSKLVRDEGFDLHTMLKGAYILREAKGPPDLILLASGSEVHLMVRAAKRLESDGMNVRVVSVLSVEIFREQDVEYKEKVLPKAVRRASLEAGHSMGLSELLRYAPDTLAMGLDHFGASAQDDVLAEKFGFTEEHVYAKIKSWLSQAS